MYKKKIENPNNSFVNNIFEVAKEGIKKECLEANNYDIVDEFFMLDEDLTEDNIHILFLRMYTEDCFLFRTMNKYLREENP